MNEQDLYIKKKLKEDEFISKKADDVFKNFFKGDVDMNVDVNQVVTEEKVSKNKWLKYKKWMSIVACVVILLGSANVYATYNGYENVFFLVKYLITGENEKVEGKENILSDKDITISYEKIDITENISMKVTNLKIKDGKAKLYLYISEKELETDKNRVPLKYEVWDERNNRLCSQTSAKEKSNISYTEELNLENYKEDDKKLILKVYQANLELLLNALIDLEHKTIEIEGEQEALKKVSEIELKEYLGLMVESLRQDGRLVYEYSEAEEVIEQAILYGNEKQLLEDMSKENENTTYQFDEVHKIASNIMEISSDKEELIQNFVEGEFLKAYMENNQKWIRFKEGGDNLTSGMCMDISDISYLNGVYTVTFTYVHLGNAPLEEQDFSKDDLLKAEIRFRYDEGNSISKFKMIDYELLADEDDKIGAMKVEREVDIETLELQDIEEIALEYRKGDGYQEGEANVVKNYKEFQYDFDGDGKEEVVKFEKNKSDEGHVAYELYFNGEEFDIVESSFCTIYIVDLNKNDQMKEVVVFDNGPSDDPHYNLYAIKNGKMQLMECIVAGFETEFRGDGIGNFAVGNKVTDYIQPKIYDKAYYYENGNLSYSDTNMNLIKDKWYKIGEEDVGIIFTEDLSNIDKYFELESERAEDEEFMDAMARSGLIEIGNDIKFKILEFTENEEVKVQLEDGRNGYLFHFSGHLAG